MAAGLDGSLCRLTNPWGDRTCNVKIVKVCEGGEIDFKLVLLDVKENDRDESVCDKSDEEPWTMENLENKLGISNPEKGKDKKTEEHIVERSKNTKNNRPFNRRYKQNNSNRYRKNYNGSPSQRNFKPFNNNGNISYNRKVPNTDSNISPWLEPPQMLNESYQFANFPSQFVPILDSSLNASNIDPPPNPPRCRGILGDSPYDQPRYKQPNFQAATNANNFSHNSNYWNGEYSNSYQRPGQNAQMPGKAAYKRHHNQKFWKNSPTSYNRNKNKNKERRGGGGRFNNYRQQ